MTNISREASKDRRNFDVGPIGIKRANVDRVSERLSPFGGIGQLEPLRQPKEVVVYVVNGPTRGHPRCILQADDLITRRSMQQISTTILLNSLANLSDHLLAKHETAGVPGT